MIPAVEAAIKTFNRKMSLPQYAGYKNSQTAQSNLFDDCLKEAMLAQETEERFGRSTV